MVLAVVLVSDRPELRAAPIVVIASVDAVVGLVGYLARYRRASSVQERARLQWPAWGVVVAGAVSLGAWVLHELLSWPDDLRTVVLATSVLIPLSLALGASERVAVRIDRLLVHTITMAGLAAMVGRVVPAHRARARALAHGRREDAARPLDARRRDRRAAVDPGARAPHRVRERAASTASVTRPTRSSARSGAA